MARLESFTDVSLGSSTEAALSAAPGQALLQLAWPQERGICLGDDGWKQLLEGSRLRVQDCC